MARAGYKPKKYPKYLGMVDGRDIIAQDEADNERLMEQYFPLPEDAPPAADDEQEKTEAEQEGLEDGEEFNGVIVGDILEDEQPEDEADEVSQVDDSPESSNEEQPEQKPKKRGRPAKK